MQAQAGGVVGGIVDRSSPHVPCVWILARFGRSPWSIHAPSRSEVAPSSPTRMTLLSLLISRSRSRSSQVPEGIESSLDLLFVFPGIDANYLRDVPKFFQRNNDLAGAVVRGLLIRLDHDLRAQRRLVRIVHAGEVLDLPREGLLVQPLDVPLRADFDRALDEDFDEPADRFPGLLPCRAVGGNRCSNRGHAVSREKLADERDPFDIGIPICPAEAQPLAQMPPHHIPVEHLDIQTAVTQGLLNQPGDGGLARRRKPRKPHRKSDAHAPLLFSISRNVCRASCSFHDDSLTHAYYHTAHANSKVSFEGLSPPRSRWRRAAQQPSTAWKTKRIGGRHISRIARRFTDLSFSE